MSKDDDEDCANSFDPPKFNKSSTKESTSRSVSFRSEAKLSKDNSPECVSDLEKQFNDDAQPRQSSRKRILKKPIGLPLNQ